MQTRRNQEAEPIRSSEDSLTLFRNTLEAISLGHLNTEDVSNHLLRYITDFKKLNRSDTVSKLLAILNHYKSMIPDETYKKLWNDIRG